MSESAEILLKREDEAEVESITAILKGMEVEDKKVMMAYIDGVRLGKMFYAPQKKNGQGVD